MRFTGRHVVAAAALFGGLVAAPADDGTTAAEAHGWGAPVAADEFGGTAVDESRWDRYGDYPGHNGNGMRLKSHDTVAGGHLTISGDADGNTGGMAWKGGRTHGRWEARMRVTQDDRGGHRYHPVLILWPDSEQWPEGGEVDYAETDAGTTSMAAFLHYGDGSPAGAQHAYDLPGALDLTQWHNYAVEWTADHLAGYVDGREWFRDTSGEVQPPGPMHQTIQLDDFHPEGNLNPAALAVDWLRLYDA